MDANRAVVAGATPPVGAGERRRRGRRWVALAAVLALAVLGLAGCQTPGPGPGPGPGPAPAGDYGAPGPYAVATTTPNGTTVLYHPAAPGQGGTRHPVILWGNGTFTSPSAYDGLLRHLASHGFIVAAASTSNAGSGQEMLAGLDYLTTANGRAGSPFNGAVDLANVGATGHSQGAIGALNTAQDRRVRTVMPIQGAASGVSGGGKPTVYLVGQEDTVAAPDQIKRAYDAATGPTAFAELAGAGHLDVLGDAGGFRSAVTAWARWQLAGDTAARGHFLGTGCGLCDARVWSRYLTNAPFRALG